MLATSRRARASLRVGPRWPRNAAIAWMISMFAFVRPDAPCHEGDVGAVLATPQRLECRHYPVGERPVLGLVQRRVIRHLRRGGWAGGQRSDRNAGARQVRATPAQSRHEWFTVLSARHASGSSLSLRLAFLR